MKPFIYPFENPTIDQALKYLNTMDFPVEIDEDQLFLWWKEKTIELCFDWGRFWAKDLIDQWYTTDEYQQIKDQRSELENRKDMTNGKSSIFVTKSLSELRRIEEARLTELEYSNDAKKLVVPKYSSYISWRDSGQDDPVPSLNCKPYGSSDEFYKYKDVPHNCDICDQSSQHWNNIREVLNSKSLILPKSEAEKIYSIFYPGQDNTTSAKEPRVYKTTLQFRCWVSLLKSHGLTNTDFEGSIEQLRRKIALKFKYAELPQDDGTLIDWLVKAEVRGQEI